MPAKNVTSESQFESEILGSSLPVLVDFWAQWCPPCRAIAPSISELAEEYAGKAEVYKLDVDQLGDLATKYSVMSIPTLLVFKNGELVERSVGGMEKARIAALLDPHV
ncbi:MAG: thioredoxin [Fimbriimonadaceae bacterium]|nr:thioredoxin [Fimbriimonadaceae bacterium]